MIEDLPVSNAKPNTERGRVPQYERIKLYLLEQIQSGYWKEGDVIPAEETLAVQFSVSRMTVNRAIRELTAEGVLSRRQGSGTYVAQQKYQATLVEIKSIAEEVRARGHRYRSQLHVLEETAANAALAERFGLKTGQQLYHSIIVHFDNDVPIQVEDRWANPKIAPNYMALDFTVTTPNEYLMEVAPLQRVNYRIEAVKAPPDIADMLGGAQGDPCLVLHRKTFSFGQVASVVTMWYPGGRYQFEGSL